jgi:hypothetical protein
MTTARRSLTMRKQPAINPICRKNSWLSFDSLTCQPGELCFGAHQRASLSILDGPSGAAVVNLSALRPRFALKGE